VNDIPFSLDCRQDLGTLPWADVDFAKMPTGVIERVALLRDGSQLDRTNVVVFVRLDNGPLIVAETTYELARQAAVFLAGSPIAENDQ
jgi:hypothetical protein